MSLKANESVGFWNTGSSLPAVIFTRAFTSGMVGRGEAQNFLSIFPWPSLFHSSPNHEKSVSFLPGPDRVGNSGTHPFIVSGFRAPQSILNAGAGLLIESRQSPESCQTEYSFPSWSEMVSSGT